MSGSNFKARDGWWRFYCLSKIKKLAIGSPGDRDFPLFEFELLVGPLAGLRIIEKRSKVLGERQDTPSGRYRAKHHSIQRERAGLPCLHILHVAARAVTCLVSDENDLLAVRKPFRCAKHVVFHGTAVQSFWSSGAGRKQDDLVVGRRHDGKRPLAVGGQRLRGAGAKHHRGRTVRRPQTHLIREPGILSFRAEQDSFTVRCDVRDHGPVFKG